MEYTGKPHCEKFAVNTFWHAHGSTVVACRPISQTVFMSLRAINRAEHVCATVVIKHNYISMCNLKIVIYILLYCEINICEILSFVIHYIHL